MSNKFGVSGEIDRLLSSIDPEFLKEPTISTDDNSEEDLSEGDTETNIDPSLLKELQDLAVDNTGHKKSSPVLVSNIDDESLEDPEILKELALLSGVEYSQPKLKTGSSITLEQVKQRQFQLKSCAVTFKKNGDINTAKSLMLEAKKLESALEFLSNGLPLESNFILPALPDTSSIQPIKTPTANHLPNISLSQPTITSTASPKQNQASLAISNKVPTMPNFTLADQFDQIIGKLEDQAEESGKLARQFYRFGDRSNALRFQRYKKGFLEQSKNVQNIRQRPSPSLPSMRVEEVSYSLPQEELDIGPNSLELFVSRAWDLAHPQLSVQLPDSYVQFTLGYVPPGAPNGNTGYSPVAYRSADPEYNFKVLLGVDNTRAWQRYAERKTLTIEVYHYRGMLFRSWSLGKFFVPLAPLLTNPTLNRTVELLHPTTRKPTGGRLELRLRLRRPIIAQPPSKIKLLWEVVIENTDKATGAISESISNNDPIFENKCENDNENMNLISSDISNDNNSNNSPGSIIDHIETQDISIPTTSHQTDIIKASLNPEITSMTPDVIIESDKIAISEGLIQNNSSAINGNETFSVEDPKDQTLSEFYDLSRIISKPVIEMELERLSSEPNPPGPLPSNISEWDSSIRHSELSLQLQMLEIKAELGQLDPSVYLSSLHKAIVNHKKLAVKLKQHNILSLARIVLFHIRTMQGEVDELISMGIA